MAKKEKQPIKGTMLDILRFAEEVAWTAAEESSERFALPYKLAFSLCRYLETYAQKWALNMAHKKGWQRILINAVSAEGDRVAYLMRKALTEVIDEDRHILWTKVEEVMRLCKEIEEKASKEGVVRKNTERSEKDDGIYDAPKAFGRAAENKGYGSELGTAKAD